MYEAAWRKSSRSANANDCVEIAGWRTSTRSQSGGQCVEVGYGLDVIGIRDTKDRSAGHLEVSAAEWRGFLAGLAD